MINQLFNYLAAPGKAGFRHNGTGPYERGHGLSAQHPSHGAGEDVASSTQNPGEGIQDSAPPTPKE